MKTDPDKLTRLYCLVALGNAPVEIELFASQGEFHLVLLEVLPWTLGDMRLPPLDSLGVLKYWVVKFVKKIV